MCSVVTQDVFNYLLKHMLDIHDQKMSLVSSYSIEYDAYMKMLITLKDYISRIEKYLECAQIQSGPNHLPFVLYGSHVYLSHDKTGENLLCSIVLPNDPRYGKSLHNGISLIDCSSAAADALLYKGAGDTVDMDICGEVRSMTIKAIEMDKTMPIYSPC